MALLELPAALAPSNRYSGGYVLYLVSIPAIEITECPIHKRSRRLDTKILAYCKRVFGRKSQNYKNPKILTYIERTPNSCSPPSQGYYLFKQGVPNKRSNFPLFLTKAKYSQALVMLLIAYFGTDGKVFTLRLGARVPTHTQAY